MTNNREKRFSAKGMVRAVLSMALIFAMVLSLSACAFFERTFAKPNELLQSVEVESLSSTINELLGYYDEFRKADTSANAAAETKFSVNVSKELLDLLQESMGTGTNVDMDWINDLELDTKIAKKDDLIQMEMGISGKSGKALSATLTMDLKASKMYIAIPELSQKVLLMDLSEMGMPSGSMGALEEAMGMLEMLPDGKELGSLVSKYITLALSCIEDAEKESATLKANGVEQKCTALETKLSLKDLAKMVKTVLKEAKKDDDLKDLILDVAELAAQNGATVDKDQIWSSFVETIDDTIENIDNAKDEMDSTKLITWTTYINNDNQVIGRRIKVKGAGEFFYGKAVSKNDFGFEMTLEANDEEVFCIEGEGTEKKNVQNASYDVVVQDKTLLTLEVKDFDLKKLESGVLNGKFKLIPSGDLLKEMGITNNSALGSLLGSAFALELEMSGDQKNGEVTIAISGAASKLISLTVSGKETSVPDINVPGNTVSDTQKWAESMDPNELMNILKKLGIPEELLGGDGVG